MPIDIIPDFAALAEHWLAEARELAQGMSFTPEQLKRHEAMGRLLKRHGWLTLDGTRATGHGTIATPWEYIAVIRGSMSLS